MKKINSLEDYKEKYLESVQDPETFWSNIASTFNWQKKWNQVLDWNFETPLVSWFKGGKLNIT